MKLFKKDASLRIVGIYPKSWFILLIVILVVSGLLQGFGTVPAGYRGVHMRFGAVTGQIFDEGLYFKIPFIDDIAKISIKIQKFTSIADASSKDLQTVEATIALNYHVEPAKTAYIYQNVATDYESELIAPAIQEVVKASMATFTAEELITKRVEVRDAMKSNIQGKLVKHGIFIDEFNIENFSFSDAFDEAVEAKVTAEQQALAAKNKLEQIKFEAQQKIESAKGSAEAIRIESEALLQAPQILQLRSIEKWNGVLPTVTGGAVPFINVN